LQQKQKEPERRQQRGKQSSLLLLLWNDSEKKIVKSGIAGLAAKTISDREEGNTLEVWE
jgi:hypothetical protein